MFHKITGVGRNSSKCLLFIDCDKFFPNSVDVSLKLNKRSYLNSAHIVLIYTLNANIQVKIMIGLRKNSKRIFSKKSDQV